MKTDELLNRAKLALQIKDYNQAVKFLLKILKLQPNSSNIYVILGIIYQNQKKYQKAMQYYKTAIGLNDNIDALNNLGVIYKELGDYNQALIQLNNALKKDGKKASIYYNIGNVYKSLDDYSKAIIFFKKALEYDSNFKPVYNNLGTVYEELKEYDDAISIYQKGLKIDPNNPKLHYNLGISYEFKNQLDSALNEYIATIKINPNLVEAYNNLGVIYEKKDNLKEAKNCFNKALTLNPLYMKALNNLGLVNEKSGDIHEAIKNYNKAITIDSNYLTVKNNLSYALAKTKNYQKAKSILEGILKKDKNNIQAYKNLSYIESQQNNYEKAIEHSKKILNIDNNNIDARNDISNMYINMGNFDKALNQLFEIKKKYPDDIHNLLNISKILIKCKKYDESLQQLNQILKNIPKNEDAIMLLGELYLEKKEFQNALDEFKKLENYGVKNNTLIYNIFKAMIGLGNFKKAIQCIEKLIKIDKSIKIDYDSLQNKDDKEKIDLFNKLINQLENDFIRIEKNDEDNRKKIREMIYDIDFKTMMEEGFNNTKEKILDTNIELNGIENNIKDTYISPIPILKIGDNEPEYDFNEEEENINLNVLENEELKKKKSEKNDTDKKSKNTSLLNLLSDQETYSDKIFNNLNEIQNKLPSIQKIQDQNKTNADIPLTEIKKNESGSVPNSMPDTVSLHPEEINKILYKFEEFGNRLLNLQEQLYKNKNDDNDKRIEDRIIEDKINNKINDKIEKKLSQMDYIFDKIKDEYRKNIHPHLKKDNTEKELNKKIQEIDDKISTLKKDILNGIQKQSESNKKEFDETENLNNNFDNIDENDDDAGTQLKTDDDNISVVEESEHVFDVKDEDQGENEIKLILEEEDFMGDTYINNNDDNLNDTKADIINDSIDTINSFEDSLQENINTDETTDTDIYSTLRDIDFKYSEEADIDHSDYKKEIEKEKVEENNLDLYSNNYYKFLSYFPPAEIENLEEFVNRQINTNTSNIEVQQLRIVTKKIKNKEIDIFY